MNIFDEFPLNLKEIIVEKFDNFKKNKQSDCLFEFFLEIIHDSSEKLDIKVFIDEKILKKLCIPNESIKNFRFFIKKLFRKK